MSWFSTNYEKAVLSGTVAIALGLGYMGWSKFAGVEQDFSLGLKGRGNNTTAVRDADLIPKTRASLKQDRISVQALDGDRPVDLFVGIPLFIKSTLPDQSVDLLKDPPVHPPISNRWWIDNRIDPGFADSPSRDPDQDGFSNLEEFLAKTDPNNATSFPFLLAKLMYVGDESLTWVLRPGYSSDGKFPFNYQDNKGGINKTGIDDLIAPGGFLFTKIPMMNRFKLLDTNVRKQFNKMIDIEVELTIVRIEDQRPNKKGTIYEFPSPLPEERMNEFQQYDRTAIFSLEALGLKGKSFKVEENTEFALPPDSLKKNYLVKKVTPGAVVVEYTDPTGGKKTVEISKGSLPKLAE